MGIALEQGMDSSPTSPVASLPLDGSVVKMKGLPFKAGNEDVLRFYGGFSIKAHSIYLKRHPDGRPSGEAFVVFESPDEAKRACQKDRETFGDKFGDRYVRGHSHMHMDSVVKMKSLPFDATQLDIIHFFESYRLKPNGVQLVVRSDNKPTGEAFVDFENYEEAAKAMREKDHKVFNEKFGDRYVRLIQVSRKEMQATLALRFGGEGILKVKGIPFKAGASDVRKFFSSYKIKPDGVSFIMHADGRPTGMAFIEFETPQEAVRAMEKDRAKFGPEYGDRFCMLQLVGRHEMDKVQLQHESESNHKIMQQSSVNGVNGVNGANGSINGLNAAALALQALAAANPALLMSQNPWLAGHMHQMLGMGMPGGHTSPLPQLGQMSTTGSGQMPHMDPAQLAAAQQLGQQLNGSVMGNLSTALNGLNLLQQSNGQAGQSQHTQAQASMPQAQDPANGWMHNGSAGDNMMFYQNGNGNHTNGWTDHRRMQAAEMAAAQWAAAVQQQHGSPPAGGLVSALSAGLSSDTGFAAI
eukprot:gene11624-11768_t